VTLTVTAVNDPPTANAQSVTTRRTRRWRSRSRGPMSTATP
jgi:hypothetical protein